MLPQWELGCYSWIWLLSAQEPMHCSPVPEELLEEVSACLPSFKREQSAKHLPGKAAGIFLGIVYQKTDVDGQSASETRQWILQIRATPWSAFPWSAWVQAPLGKLLTQQRAGRCYSCCLWGRVTPVWTFAFEHIRKEGYQVANGRINPDTKSAGLL